MINHMKLDGIVKRSIYTVGFFIARDKVATRLRYDLRFIDCSRVLKYVLKRSDIFFEVLSVPQKRCRSVLKDILKHILKPAIINERCMMQKSASKKPGHFF